MKKTLYIHIGNYKTGTSSIQKFCHDNFEVLKKSGLHYFQGCRPDKNNTNHGRLSLELYKQYGGVPPGWYSDDYDFTSAVNAIKQEISEHNECAKFLISSEEFYRVAGLEQGKEAVQLLKDSFSSPDFDIKIIMYVREPLSFMVSWYNQIVKGRALPARTFNDFVYSTPDFLVNPYVNYNAWSEVFSTENIFVKQYQYKGNQHLQDFFEAVTPGFKGLPEEEGAVVNTSVDAQVLENRRIGKLVAGYKNKSLNKQVGLNGYVNSAVLSDATVLRKLSHKVSHIYQQNSLFYKSFFNKEITLFDVCDVIALSSKINRINIQSFWRHNPSIDALVKQAASLRKANPQAALELFKIAKTSRPEGPFIQKNINELRAIVTKRG